MKRISMLAAAAIVAGTALAGAPAVSQAGVLRAAAGPMRQAMPAWIVSDGALQMLSQAGLTRNQLQELFGSKGTFLTGTTGQLVNGAIRTATFTSYAKLRAALDGPGLPPGTRAVLYDNEGWSLTPAAERLHPAEYEELAARLVHAHHLLFVSTPATTLTDVLDPGDTDHYAAYLRLGLAASGARYADVIDIQAQGSEADLSTYVAFVQAAAAQARRANPAVMVLAGISTNPSGQRITGAQLAAAFRAVRPYVDGFWLNIPQAGAACPRCGTAQPAVAIPLLRSLLSS